MINQSVPLVFVYLGEKLPKYAVASLQFAVENAKVPIVLISNIKNPPEIHPDIKLHFYAYKDSRDSNDSYSKFRDGFWLKTTERFYALEQFMADEQIKKFFHAELDNLVFNLSQLAPKLDKLGEGIFVPSDHVDRAIGSLMYTNSQTGFTEFCEYARSFNFRKNDMEILASFIKNSPRIAFPLPSTTSDIGKVDVKGSTNLTRELLSDIGLFDAAAVGQWYFGIDPKNSFNRIHNRFLNEMFDGDLQDFLLVIHEDVSELYLHSKSNFFAPIRLHNLHVHSKIHNKLVKKQHLIRIIDETNKGKRVVIAANLSGKLRFLMFMFLSLVTMSKAIGKHTILSIYKGTKSIFEIIRQMQDVRRSRKLLTEFSSDFSLNVRNDNCSEIAVFIPVAPKDYDILSTCVESLRANLLNPISRVVICGRDHPPLRSICLELECDFVDETLLAPLPKENLRIIINGSDRSGWIFQQLLKLNVFECLADDNVLIWDADTCLIRKMCFQSHEQSIIEYSLDKHPPYFLIATKLLGDFPNFEFGLTCHKLIVNRYHMQEMKTEIEKHCSKKWQDAIISNLDLKEGSSFSEYALYSSFMIWNYPQKVILKHWRNRGVEKLKSRMTRRFLSFWFNSISCHSYSRVSSKKRSKK